MATGRRRAGTVGAMAMEVTVAVTLLALLVPQDKVLCRAGGGHEALESVLAACCGAAGSDDGCGSPMRSEIGATAGGGECTDLAVPLPSLCVRPQQVLPCGLVQVAGLEAGVRGPDRRAAVSAAASAPAPTLACVRTTTLLI
jgi:hypothetical protein